MNGFAYLYPFEMGAWRIFSPHLMVSAMAPGEKDAKSELRVFL